MYNSLDSCGNKPRLLLGSNPETQFSSVACFGWIGKYSILERKCDTEDTNPFTRQNLKTYLLIGKTILPFQNQIVNKCPLLRHSENIALAPNVVFPLSDVKQMFCTFILNYIHIIKPYNKKNSHIVLAINLDTLLKESVRTGA